MSLECINIHIGRMRVVLLELTVLRTDHIQDARSSDTDQAEPSRTVLSAESLHQLPDTSKNRIELIARQFERSSDYEDLRLSDEEPENEQLALQKANSTLAYTFSYVWRCAGMIVSTWKNCKGKVMF